MGCVNQVLILILISLSALFFSTSTAQDFKCNTPGRCSALVGYSPHNTTTISDILNLFNIKNLRNVLGANDLPLNTSRNHTVEAKQTIKIPISCLCSNGTGVVYNGPEYTVKKDDGLYFIASEVFAGLVVYQKIQSANKITNADLIDIGQNLTIPLPCSCDDVDGDNKVVHYAHVVQTDSTLESIAKQFGTNEDTLKKINDIADDSQLIADRSIDVPLKACNSSIKSESPDNGLRVANGTYVFTANNCVKCRCDSASSPTLQCEQTQLKLASPKWEKCPAMQCEGSESLSIGNSTKIGCSQTTCTYAGYTNQTILTVTTVDTLTTCSNPPNIASRIGSSWSVLFISSIHLIPLFLHLFQ
ncbi:hypothetical protein Ddye_004274 [Dipteronia dyeriana]|uniref:LysM domain-containing protein n=1 Tax=Dipteronia dyeriana TaxID=168575 RepID=A0AAD9XUC0_9ROSI|nr:hypothetical protein Ddye_004274 [Dipteronia dyeriana]